MGKTQILGTVAIVPKGDWQENTSYELLNLIRYEGASYLAIRNVPENTLPTDVNYWQLVATDGAANINFENGTGDYSIVQKTAEGEENEATAEGTYAGGKKSKTTAKRGFTHGNTVLNNGNSAASFGQQYTNDGNVALTQMADGYNGGAGAVVVGQNIYNKKNQTANVPSSEGGSASALVGAYLYNRGSHAQTMGYLLKNRKALKTVLGIANKDKENTIFEIGGGKEITTVASDNSSFTYNGYTYTVNYDENNKIVSITFPTNAPSYPKTIDYRDEQGHTDFRVETEGGVEICLALVNGVLKVYEPYNIFEIDENGGIRNFGGVYFRTCRNEVGKRKSFLYFDEESATWSVGDGKAQVYMKDDKVEVAGTLSATNAPQKPNDVVRLQDLPAGGGKTYYRHSVVLTNININNKAITAYIPQFTSSSSSSISSFDELIANTGRITLLTFQASSFVDGFGSSNLDLFTFSGRAYSSEDDDWFDFRGHIMDAVITDTVTEL